MAQDSDTDLAVVRIATAIPNGMSSPIAPINPIRGESIWIVGNPQLQYATLTRGNVSSVHRQVETDKVRDVLQVAGGLVGGNSGGAIYNEGGEIIGVAHAMSPRAYAHLAYVIPASVINKFLADNKSKF